MRRLQSAVGIPHLQVAAAGCLDGPELENAAHVCGSPARIIAWNAHACRCWLQLSQLKNHQSRRACQTLQRALTWPDWAMVRSAVSGAPGSAGMFSIVVAVSTAMTPASWHHGCFEHNLLHDTTAFMLDFSPSQLKAAPACHHCMPEDQIKQLCPCPSAGAHNMHCCRKRSLIHCCLVTLHVLRAAARLTATVLQLA